MRTLILATRGTVAHNINSALVILYWQIGARIRMDILKEQRAGYGEKIFHTLSGKLALEFGRGFSERNLANMARFAETFPDSKILHAVCAKLSWYHLRRVQIDGRDYYLDLLFYHRKLKRLIAIVLKIGDFDASPNDPLYNLQETGNPMRVKTVWKWLTIIESRGMNLSPAVTHGCPKQCRGSAMIKNYLRMNNTRWWNLALGRTWCAPSGFGHTRPA